MYEAHWQLSRKPFEAAADVAFHYPVAAHHAARLKIQYAIESRRAAALLVGGPGMGKTLLVRGLVRQLSEGGHRCIHVDYPLLNADELLCQLARAASGAYRPADGKVDNLDRLEQAFRGLCEANQHGVIVIEEAHLLSDPAVAETLRILPYLGQNDVPMVTVLLVGQSSLAAWLSAFPAWEEHFGAKCHLPALTCEETMGYVAHRLRAAGATKNPFTNKSLEALHHLANGSPRRINRLADLALLVSFAEDLRQVDVQQIEAVSDELTLCAD